jgi:cell division protein FtsX
MTKFNPFRFKANRKNVLAIFLAILAIVIAVILILLNINKPKQTNQVSLGVDIQNQFSTSKQATLSAILEKSDKLDDNLNEKHLPH